MILETTTQTIAPDITVVALKGRLTLGNTLSQTEESVKKLINGGCRKLAIDLAELSFTDSAGLGVLISWHGTMAKAGGKLHIAAVPARIMDLLVMTQVNRVLSLYPDVAAATAAF